jgi:hypothetical protein
VQQCTTATRLQIQVSQQRGNRCPLRTAFLTGRPLFVLDDSRSQPLVDQPQDPLVRDPVLEKPSKPGSIKPGEEVADVRVQHPVHALTLDPDRQRVQRIMRRPPRPETVRETPEIHLVHGVKHLDDRPLNDLVFQRGDTQRPQTTVRLRYVRPATWLGPVASRLHPSVQVQEVSLQILPVLGPRHPVHPRRGLRTDRPIRRPEPTRCHVVQQRGEPRSLVPSRYLPHTIQRTGHVGSGAVSGTCFAVRVPLDWLPFLTHPRRRSIVRWGHRYYAAIRLPTLVHLRRTTMCSLSGPPTDHTDGRTWDLPVLVYGVSRACPGSLTARGPPAARA